jgi:hypothetical protein
VEELLGGHALVLRAGDRIVVSMRSTVTSAERLPIPREWSGRASSRTRDEWGRWGSGRATDLDKVDELCEDVLGIFGEVRVDESPCAVCVRLRCQSVGWGSLGGGRDLRLSDVGDDGVRVVHLCVSGEGRCQEERKNSLQREKEEQGNSPPLSRARSSGHFGGRFRRLNSANLLPTLRDLRSIKAYADRPPATTLASTHAGSFSAQADPQRL